MGHFLSKSSTVAKRSDDDAKATGRIQQTRFIGIRRAQINVRNRCQKVGFHSGIMVEVSSEDALLLL
jgi:hypothetical protein